MDDKETEEAHVLTGTMTKVGGGGGPRATHGGCVWGPGGSGPLQSSCPTSFFLIFLGYIRQNDTKPQ